MLGPVVGKVVGIAGFSWLACRLGLASMLATGIGALVLGKHEARAR